MFPLLFTLGMDYLDVILCYLHAQEGFKFHIYCRELKLTHLYMLCRRPSFILPW